jgi:hypothetical protein
VENYGFRLLVEQVCGARSVFYVRQSTEKPNGNQLLALVEAVDEPVDRLLEGVHPVYPCRLPNSGRHRHAD